MADAPAHTPTVTRHALLVIAALWGVYLAAALPLIFAGFDRGRGAFDQQHFHLPAIRQFIAELPHPDFRDYPSATTPGYHIAVAVAARCLGATDERAIRLIGGMFTLGLLATVGALASFRGAAAGIVIALPVAASLYVFSAGAWAVPDNSGWWTLLLAMLLALRPRTDLWTFIGAAVLLFAVAMTRQVNVWIAAPIVAAVWNAGTGRAAYRTRDTLLVILAFVPAIAALLWLFHLWHGLIPPNQRQLIGGGNLAGLPGVFSDIGVLGFFYLGFFVRREHLRSFLGLFVMGAVLGAIVALIPSTTHDQPAGRYSGLWNITAHVPILMGRTSTLILATSALGGGILLVWIASFPRRERLVWAVAAAAFIAAQVANHNAFYRYYEPVILMAAVITLARRPGALSRRALVGPLLLALLLATVTALSIIKGSAV